MQWCDSNFYLGETRESSQNIERLSRRFPNGLCGNHHRSQAKCPESCDGSYYFINEDILIASSQTSTLPSQLSRRSTARIPKEKRKRRLTAFVVCSCGHSSRLRADTNCLQPQATAISEGDRMLGALFQPAHLIILAIICIFLFGGKLFANLGKGFAAGIRNFKNSTRPSGKP
jgi:hypothetical protein